MLVRGSSRVGKSVNPVEKLRQLIRRKTSERDKLLREITQCETALTPMRQRQLAMTTVDREIHEIFGALLANPKLNKRTKNEIQTLYEALQDDQVISLDPARAAARSSVCQCPACSGSDDESEIWPEELGADEPASDPGTYRAAPASHEPKRKERDASVRALYRKLALQFHPDRAEDESRRAEHEAVMRQVNDAYHGGDTERLLDLSRELGIDVGELKECDGIFAELVQQYEHLKAEVRDIRSSPLGTLVIEMRRASKHGYRSPIDDLDEQAALALEQLTGMRDFARDFALGKISLKTFLKGPQFEAPVEAVDEEDLLLEVLEMVETLDRAARKSNGSAHGNSRQGTRPRS
jgi:hypothetical protein